MLNGDNSTGDFNINSSLTIYSDVESNQAYSSFAKHAQTNGLFPDTKFYMDKKVTRREVTRVVFHLYQLGKLMSK